MSDALVILPTYNEVENIENMVDTIFALEKKFHILVVDDNSPDGTHKKVNFLQITHRDNLFLLKREKKEGLGKAYLDGFTWALENKYDYIFEMDADFSHNPKDLIRLYNTCKNGGADLAIGSRYVKGINVVNWPIERVLLSYVASLYVRLVTGMPVHDATAGYKCYKRQVLESINFENIKFVGYAFQIEMKYKSIS